jgi:predicted Fe-Mo cluster-binding NifX family protein
MKIAIGMSEKETINDDHFGQSKFFNIYEYKNGEFIKIEERENPKYGTHQHAKVSDMLEFLDDCKVWVGGAMGKGSYNKLKEMGYVPVIVESLKLNEALEEIKRVLEVM